MAIPEQPDCTIRGARVEIRRLRTGDLAEMRAWEPHQDPLLQDYNLSYETAAEWHSWLRHRLRHRWAYAIRNGGDVLIGHLSLRHLDVPRSSRLGFSIAAQYVDQGYGQDAMGAFLDYYYDTLSFEEMRLDVSGANPRARHLYQKLGFQEVGTFWREAPWGAKPTPETRRHFRWGRIRFFEMRLTAIDWRRISVDRE
ncbi:MAG: GNAT family N-acetyltransferase [Anaerolineae bacterium]|nr:GNAT family N-acetyltransferase [Anaerolineae bacterium]